MANEAQKPDAQKLDAQKLDARPRKAGSHIRLKDGSLKRISGPGMSEDEKKEAAPLIKQLAEAQAAAAAAAEAPAKPETPRPAANQTSNTPTPAPAAPAARGSN
jgi:hypothetical protein